MSESNDDHLLPYAFLVWAPPSGIGLSLPKLIQRANTPKAEREPYVVRMYQDPRGTPHPGPAGDDAHMQSPSWNAENQGFTEHSTAASGTRIPAEDTDGFTTPPPQPFERRRKQDRFPSDSPPSSTSTIDSWNDNLPVSHPHRSMLGSTPPLSPSKHAADKAAHKLHSSGSMFPDILSCSKVVKVLTLDPAADPLIIHKSICYFYMFPKEMMTEDETVITFPTKSLDAAKILLGYCYNNGTIGADDMGELSLHLTMELWLLASKLDMLLLSTEAAMGIREKLQTADIPQVCDFTRLRVAIENDELKKYAALLPNAVDVWMEDGKYRWSWLT
jgi:hypothetical protein